VSSTIAIWTASFVFLTLIINAPSIRCGSNRELFIWSCSFHHTFHAERCCICMLQLSYALAEA
jgi:hypothetical protein